MAARCARLGDRLPTTLDALRPRPTTPRSPLVHAWGSPAVLLSCGVPPLAGGTAGRQAVVVNGVGWYQHVSSGAVDWTAVRPGAVVALHVPSSYDGQGAFLVDLAPAVRAALP